MGSQSFQHQMRSFNQELALIGRDSVHPLQSFEVRVAEAVNTMGHDGDPSLPTMLSKHPSGYSWRLWYARTGENPRVACQFLDGHRAFEEGVAIGEMSGWIFVVALVFGSIGSPGTFQSAAKSRGRGDR